MPITLSRQQHPRCRRRRGKLRRYISEALIPVSGFRFRRQYDLAPPRIGPKIRPRHPQIRPQNPARHFHLLLRDKRRHKKPLEPAF